MKIQHPTLLDQEPAEVTSRAFEGCWSKLGWTPVEEVGTTPEPNADADSAEVPNPPAHSSRKK